MGYLLLGSIFLAIGSMATTVREVQTMSMPVTMAQVLVFFFASYAMAQARQPVEMLAIASRSPRPSPCWPARRWTSAWPHVLALAWQALCVALFIRFGARLFRSG